MILSFQRWEIWNLDGVRVFVCVYFYVFVYVCIGVCMYTCVCDNFGFWVLFIRYRFFVQDFLGIKKQVYFIWEDQFFCRV